LRQPDDNRRDDLPKRQRRDQHNQQAEPTRVPFGDRKFWKSRSIASAITCGSAFTLDEHHRTRGAGSCSLAATVFSANVEA
jgi:hypothetical protein